MVGLLFPLGAIFPSMHVHNSMRCCMKRSKERYGSVHTRDSDYDDHIDEYSLYSKRSGSTFGRRKRKSKSGIKNNEKRSDGVKSVKINKTKNDKKLPVEIYDTELRTCSVLSASKSALEGKSLDKQCENEENDTSNNCHPSDFNTESDTFREIQKIVLLVDYLNRQLDTYESDIKDCTVEENPINESECDEKSFETYSEDDETVTSIESQEMQSEDYESDDIMSLSDSSSSIDIVSSMLKLSAAEDDSKPLEETSGESVSTSQVSLPSGLQNEGQIKEPIDEVIANPERYSALDGNWLLLLNRVQSLQQRTLRHEQSIHHVQPIPPTITIASPPKEPKSKCRDRFFDDSGTEVTAVSTLASSSRSSFSSCYSQHNNNIQQANCCLVHEKDKSYDQMTPKQKCEQIENERQDRSNLRVELMVDTLMLNDSSKNFRNATEYINFMSSEKDDSSTSDHDDDSSSISTMSAPQDLQEVLSSESTGKASYDADRHWSDNYDIDDYKEEFEENNKYPFKVIHNAHYQYDSNFTKRQDEYGGDFCESDEDDDEYEFNMEMRNPIRMETIREEQEDDNNSRNTCSTRSRASNCIAYEVNRIVQKMRFCPSPAR